jgi:hypothetical protein
MVGLMPGFCLDNPYYVINYNHEYQIQSKNYQQIKYRIAAVSKTSCHRTCTKACKVEFQYAANIVPRGAKKSLQIITIGKIIRGE